MYMSQVTMNLPLLFLLASFFFLKASFVSSSSLPLELTSLIALESTAKGPLSSFRGWDLNSNLSQADVQKAAWCSWPGVKCDPKTGQVTSLDLSRHNLSGRIPAEVRHLSRLEYLNLSGNALEGPLQPALYELRMLRIIDISHNNFNSTFPPGISKIKFLKVFNAYSNSFEGPLPGDFARLQYLEQLNLGGSYFKGRIPAVYGSFPRLKFLYLQGNSLEGPIPTQLGFLSQLVHLEIGYNQYSGGVPREFSSLSNLQYLDISSAVLSSPLPQELGNLTMLQTLLLFKNQITGEIPASFGNLKSLKVMDLSANCLSGTIPSELASLKELTLLHLMSNQLTGIIPNGIGELPNLETLNLWNNSLSGILPQKLGSSARLQILDVSSNSLRGPIPPNVCRGNKLTKLILFSNRFVHELPQSLANCSSLSRLRIQGNWLSGSIPHGFGSLTNLIFMDLSKNNFTGQIPGDLGNAPKLQYLNISENSFYSTLPNNIWSAPSLKIFSASWSQLYGKIPDFIGCQALYKIELQENLLNGSIPWDIGHCEKLLCLNLSRNLLTGIIPWEISALPSVTDVDLSHNFLTGTIPSNFGNCRTLENFNVSFNMLTGPVPSSGSIFPNLHPSSFAGNEGLCGGILAKPCAPNALSASEIQNPKKHPKRAGTILWIMTGALGIGLFVLVVGSRCFQADKSYRFTENKDIGPWKLTAFQRLNFTADDLLECLEMSNKIIGMGSTGTVYKAEMPAGEIIAVKKLRGKNKDNIRRRRGVLAEVEVLGNVRHRNIVRLLGCCSNRECTMLLYEYMPNGNLEELIHGKNKGENLVADWLTRYKIALGVAQGICYLHHDCDPVIVHRDLKSSNILLDAEMEVRVADFGVAKLIEGDESMSVIAGSYGYIAPEYAYTLQVDEKSDIYSYGVVLLELLTGKRSIEAEFGDGNSIDDWVRSKIKTKDGMNNILDKNCGAPCGPVRQEMMQMLTIALLCTSRNPADRPSMRDVVLMLQEAKPKRKMPPGGVVSRDNEVTGCVGPLAEKPKVEC